MGTTVKKERGGGKRTQFFNQLAHRTKTYFLKGELQTKSRNISDHQKIESKRSFQLLMAA